jgi:hypothetical protein
MSYALRCVMASHAPHSPPSVCLSGWLAGWLAVRYWQGPPVSLYGVVKGAFLISTRNEFLRGRSPPLDSHNSRLLRNHNNLYTFQKNPPLGPYLEPKESYLTLTRHAPKTRFFSPPKPRKLAEGVRILTGDFQDFQPSFQGNAGINLKYPAPTMKEHRGSRSITPFSLNLGSR